MNTILLDITTAYSDKPQSDKQCFESGDWFIK